MSKKAALVVSGAVAAAAFGLAGGLTQGSAAAQAHRGDSAGSSTNQYGPPAGSVRLYNNTKYRGTLCTDYDNDSNYSKGGQCKGRDNNRASSVINNGYNNGKGCVTLYAGKNYDRTLRYNLGVHRKIKNLHIHHYIGRPDYKVGNSVSSHKWFSC